MQAAVDPDVDQAGYEEEVLLAAAAAAAAAAAVTAAAAARSVTQHGGKREAKLQTDRGGGAADHRTPAAGIFSKL